ncbi:hypothetical protein LCGC14_0459450 [marine sediment metagenome]|uniref:ATP-grasp domain-containing protein n=1 Tax=marine sediment metagenome TaxID=412755 RepID=A0A0F9V2E5_9ZZZZ
MKKEEGEMRLVKKYLKEIKHYLSIKTDGTLVRNEWQEKIPEWAFDVAWPKTYHNRLEITRHFIYWNRVLEIDEYHGRYEYEGLIKLEVEFDEDNLNEPEKFSYPSNRVKDFQLPHWIGPAIEVTDDKRFNNKNLAGLVTVQTKTLLEEADEVPDEFIQEVVRRINGRINFYVIDVGQLESGEWIVVELNDSQMAGLSENNPNVLYANLAKVLKDDS